MSQEIEELVAKLVTDGYGYLSVDQAVVHRAKHSAQIFIDSLNHIHQQLTLTREGELLPDIGVIDKQRGGIKTYLHLAHDMPLYAQNVPLTPLQRRCLREMDMCRRYLENIGADIASYVGQKTGNVELKQRVLDAARISSPYNVSTLRFVSYPDVPGQKGAFPRRSRSFLTMHLGDRGGKLFLQNKQGEWEYVSPPEGSILVFCGAKALQLTEGKLQPIFYKSETVRGEKRSAAVMFIHADVGHPVSSAREEYERFYAT